MKFNIEDLKKKIIYRSKYRGSKEMDSLLGDFTKKFIDQLNYDDLITLSIFLDIDDENLYKFKSGLATSIKIENNKISNLFKNFKYNIL
tara:strand:+ start:105 stop:371 length:267 start_codon:yes stop_codon:yes gene_type:complete